MSVTCKVCGRGIRYSTAVNLHVVCSSCKAQPTASAPVQAATPAPASVARPNDEEAEVAAYLARMKAYDELGVR